MSAHQTSYSDSGIDPAVVFEWDVANWSRALPVWEAALPVRLEGTRGLEIGARNGGLSLWLAGKGVQMVCSDLYGPAPEAHALHRRAGVDGRVRYAGIDATDIAFADAIFDLVIFKSVLGGVGHSDRIDKQLQAVREMHRVLKPGGMLLFAENLTGSAMHKWLRRSFVKWGQQWRYVTMNEMSMFIERFDAHQLWTAGCVAAFGRTEWQRQVLTRLDRVLEPWMPTSARYIVYGWARK